MVGDLACSSYGRRLVRPALPGDGKSLWEGGRTYARPGKSFPNPNLARICTGDSCESP